MTAYQNTNVRVTEDYVILHRKLAKEFRNKEISREEFYIYVWLKINANPYAISITSSSNLNDDLFYGKKTVNYINKLLLSLKKKQYIHYEDQSGRRGTFEVKLGDFLLPTKILTNLKNSEKNSEDLVSQSLILDSQKTEAVIDIKNELVSRFSSDAQVRGSNNDTNNNKNNNKNCSKVVASKEVIRTDLFKPKDNDEFLCKKINMELGDSNMRYILSIKSRYGISTVEQSFNSYKERINPNIKDKPAFFNFITQEVIKNTP